MVFVERYGPHRLACYNKFYLCYVCNNIKFSSRNKNLVNMIVQVILKFHIFKNLLSISFDRKLYCCFNTYSDLQCKTSK